MKKRLLIVSLAASFLLLIRSAGASSAETKIAVVDINRVFSNYRKVAESQEEFDKFKAERQAEIDKKAEEVNKEIKPLQDQLDSKALKKEEADKIEAEINTKRQTILNLQREIYQELQKKNRELVEARVAEITDAVAKIAREKGYTVVINKEAVLYVPEANDISNLVLELLNKQPAKKAEPKKAK